MKVECNCSILNGLGYRTNSSSYLEMMRQTSPNKLRGKLVKYILGDCLIIQTDDSYIGAIITDKFNKYYNLTCMDFNLKTKPIFDNFINGRLFGARYGSWEELLYGVDQRMVECKYVDNESRIEKVGSIELIPNFVSAGYAYLSNVDEIFEYYREEIHVRIEKSNDAEKYPAIAFVGRHLLDTEKVTSR